MKLQFKNFAPECFQFMPSINVWMDQDVFNEGYKYMLFVGWLNIGWRIYFGRNQQEQNEQT